MKAIKDFLYRNNDILIVVLIILLGAGIIYAKTNNILHYKADEPVVTQEKTENDANNSNNQDDSNLSNADSQDDSDEENTSQAYSNQEDALSSTQPSQKEIIIDPDSSIEQVSTKLFEMGNATNENEFKNKIEEYGGTRVLRPGTYLIDNDESMDSILKKITQTS